jgi:alpha-D-ribose 1-methylphosphonate 5-triphosphate synthase subunit PhnH
MESCGHKHAKATLILMKTIPVQSGCGTEDIPAQSQTLIIQFPDIHSAI